MLALPSASRRVSSIRCRGTAMPDCWVSLSSDAFVKSNRDSTRSEARDCAIDQHLQSPWDVWQVAFVLRQSCSSKLVAEAGNPRDLNGRHFECTSTGYRALHHLHTSQDARGTATAWRGRKGLQTYRHSPWSKAGDPPSHDLDRRRLPELHCHSAFTQVSQRLWDCL